MSIEFVRIQLDKLEQNTGQVEGLPSNPRNWTQTDIDRLAKSLKETPELFEARPLLVYPYKGKFVILGGNLRYEGAKQNGDETAPCFVFKEETPVEKLKEIVIKDNGQFGQWDMHALDMDWAEDEQKLVDWGIIGFTGMFTPEGGLPEELQGVDLAPDALDEFKGDDETERCTLIINYTESTRWKVEELLGQGVTAKVVWRFEDMIKEFGYGDTENQDA